ncbi:hypothetical protein [Mycobacterium simiae]|uniref:Uncharacterized protein n=1 Tax=Mycobacterium simiae TaxID=1784 RepID=A0A1X0XIV7_MYCSI|nr:hypothetical protein [Mycobacterium simiae]ORJ52849.1 hypothetical protein B5M45_30020 [Mycobacterium simiae]
MAKARRSPWMNERTSLLLARLGEYEMTLPEDIARQLISDHLDTTAELMRIGRQAAKFYVTDDVIAKIADQLLGIDQAKSHDGVVSITAARRRKTSAKLSGSPSLER